MTAEKFSRPKINILDMTLATAGYSERVGSYAIEKTERMDCRQTVLNVVEKTVPKGKDAKPEDLIDDSVIRKLDQSGFIDQLYK
jgi:hypothetical protein